MTVIDLNAGFPAKVFSSAASSSRARAEEAPLSIFSRRPTRYSPRMRSTGRGHRPQQTAAETGAQACGEVHDPVSEHRRVAVAQRERREPRIGRIEKGFALGELCAGHPLEIARRDLPDHGMPRFGGLDHHLAPVIAPSGAARHLHHQLESPFGGPEIGVVQQVGRH